MLLLDEDAALFASINEQRSIPWEAPEGKENKFARRLVHCRRVELWNPPQHRQQLRYIALTAPGFARSEHDRPGRASQAVERGTAVLLMMTTYVRSVKPVCSGKGSRRWAKLKY
jgi:hypothetical protein